MNMMDLLLNILRCSFVPVLLAFVLKVFLDHSPESWKKVLKMIGVNLSRKSHAFISSTLSETYNESVEEKKEELFQTMAKYINSNDVRMLEIGAGSGANLKYYPTNVNIQFVAVDPNQYVEKYLRRNIVAYKNIELERFSNSFAENMKDIPSDSIDCLVSTIVLCSVTDQEKVLTEVIRVLKPGCPFFFMEHVAATPGSYLHKAQKIFRKLWGFCFDGCDITRESVKSIQKAGFREVKYEEFDARLYYIFSVLRPTVFGYAIK